MKKMPNPLSALNPMVTLAADRESIPRVKQTAKGRTKWSLLLGIGLTALVLAVSSSQATLQTYDGFNYTPTGPGTLDDKSGGFGWDFVSWGQFLGGATSCIITNGSLSDPSATLYTSSNKVYSAGGFAGRFFSQPPPNGYGWPGSTTYFSILIRPESAPATNHYYGLQLFSNGNDTGTNTSDVLIGKTGADLYYGLEYSSNDVAGATNVFVHTYSGTQATSNQTVFLVVRVDFADPSGADTFRLYVNPPPGGAEPGTADATLSVDIGAQNGLALNSGNGARVSFDEVRMGITFASVSSTVSLPEGGDLVTYEPFAYNQTNSTATLAGQPNNGTQASNGWDNVTWGMPWATGTSYTNVADSLSDPSGLLVTSGNKVTTGGGQAGRWPYLGGAAYGAAGTTNYYSILIRPESTPDPTNSYFGLQLYSNNADGPDQHDLFIGKTGAGLFYGLEYSTNNMATNVFIHTFSATQAVSNQSVLLVTRVVFGPTNSADFFSLYVNPTPGAPEPLTADATLSFQFGRQNGLVFNAGGGPVSYDEIRIGTTFADVTPAVPTDFRILSIAKAGNDIVLTWITTGGKIDVVQATGGSNGSFSTNGFANISPSILIPGSTSYTTNYVDIGGATNQPARYYRITHP